MLTLEEIAALVEPWFVEGRIRQADFERLKAQYLTDIGAPKGQCTTCSSFRSDVQHHFRYQLRQNKIPIMESNRQYVLADDVAFLQYPGDSRLIVNEASDDDENRMPLTNEVAATLLALDDEYKNYIVPNPDYKAPSVAAPPKVPATPPASRTPPAPKKQTGPKAPAQKKAADGQKEQGEQVNQQQQQQQAETPPPTQEGTPAQGETEEQGLATTPAVPGNAGNQLSIEQPQ